MDKDTKTLRKFLSNIYRDSVKSFTTASQDPLVHVYLYALEHYSKNQELMKTKLFKEIKSSENRQLTLAEISKCRVVDSHNYARTYGQPMINEDYDLCIL